MLKTLLISTGCFLLGATSAYFAMTSERDNAALASAPSPSHTGESINAQPVLPEALLSEQDWSSAIEALNGTAYDEIARIKLSIDIVESPFDDQLTFIHQSFAAEIQSQNLIAVQGFVLTQLAKRDPYYALNLLQDMSLDQRNTLGVSIINGYIKNDALAALTWLNSDTITKELNFLSAKGLSKAKHDAIKHFASEGGDLFQAFGFIDTLDDPRREGQLQRSIAKRMVREGLDLAMSQALSSGPNGAPNQGLLNRLVSAWAEESPRKLSRYLLDNHDLLNGAMAQALSQELLQKGYAREYQQLFERTTNPEVKEALAMRASISEAQRNNFNSALNWLSRLPEGQSKNRVIMSSALAFKPDADLDDSMSLAQRLNFIEQGTKTDERLQEMAYYVILDNWQISAPTAVTEFVMNLPSDRATMKTHLKQRLDINEE